MLQALNDRIKGWLGAFVVALITIPFALWGIQTYVGGGGDKYVAKVNGNEITSMEVDRAYTNQLARLRQQFGDELPFSNDVIKEQVVSQLINNRVLESASYARDYRISDALLADNIRVLFSRDGVFDRVALESTLASQGLTTSQFETMIRNDMRTLQKRNSILQTAFVTREEAEELARLQEQKRDISLIRFNLEAYSDGIDISEEAIAAFYNDNPERYSTPESISVDYIEITTADMADDVEVDEAMVNALYEDYRARMLSRQERKARHILMQTGDSADNSREAVMARMDEIRKKLAAGADFAELAKAYSEDPGSAQEGGDLGWVRPGDMVKPFEDALFNMEKGEISEVVESQFGLHLIQLDDIRTPDILSLEDKRGDFEQQLREDKVNDLFFDISESLATAAYENPDSLDAALEAVNGSLKSTGVFTRNSGEGIADSAEFRKAAFRQTVIEGMNSDIVELEPGHVVVMRVREYTPAKPRPLEEVRDTIRSVLELREAFKRTRAAALEVREKLEGGATVESVLSGGQVVEKIGEINRNESTRVSREIAAGAFQMPYPSEQGFTVKDVDLFSGDVVLVLLNAVSTPENVDPDKIQLARQQRTSDVAQAEFDYVLDAVKADAEIERASTTVSE